MITLSDKICGGGMLGKCISTEDVKEFIKDLKRCVMANKSIRYEKRKHLQDKINKLAGDKLI